MANMSNRQSYLAKQDANKKNRQAAGLVTDKFTNVENMVIDMVYYQNLSNPILMYRKLNVFPSSYAYFKMDCMIKECEDGVFDLGPVIRDMVKKRKKSAKGSLKCTGSTNRKDLGPDHASIDYDITITYYPASVARRIQKELAATRAAKAAEPVKPEGKAVVEKPKRKKAIKAAAIAATKKASSRKAEAKMAEARKAPAKKAPAKKAPAKKAPAKKAPAKKAPAKKAPAKKAPAKKAPAKKAPAKKAAGRKK